ncbi:MAG: hypothetical protein ACI9YB_001456 [Halioglobus sp.]|jgi:hypothetical protein
MSTPSVEPFLYDNNLTLAKEENQDWKYLREYCASSTFEEKICRVGNYVAFGAAAFGVISRIKGRRVSLGSCLGMIQCQRKLISSVIGYISNPVAVNSLSSEGRESMRKEGEAGIHSLQRDGYFVRKVSIYKSGTRYEGILTGHRDTIDNGHWTVYALGRNDAVEFSLERIAKECRRYSSNSLLINAPSIGESGGYPTTYQMGAGFEAGLQLLEKEVRATHILMRGFSFGGAMMGEAILNHDFTEGQDKGIKYFAISDRTFAYFSSMAASFVSESAGKLASAFIEPICKIAGAELNTFEAAKKLSDSGIRHIVIQHISPDSSETDGIIPDCISLANEMHKAEEMEGKLLLESEEMGHCGRLYGDLDDRLDEEINSFFNPEL